MGLGKSTFNTVQIAKAKLLRLSVAIQALALLCLVCFSVAAVAEKDSADTVADKNDNPELSQLSIAPEFAVVPKRCVLKSGQDFCRIQLTLSWQATRARDLCLTEKGDDLALACWEEAVRGATRLLFVGAESVTYVLTQQGSVMSEVTFSVGRVSKNRRKSNKRRRRLWRLP